MPVVSGAIAVIMGALVAFDFFDRSVADSIQAHLMEIVVMAGGATAIVRQILRSIALRSDEIFGDDTPAARALLRGREGGE